MNDLKFARRGGMAAMLGGILGLLYAPFYALAYFATEDGASSLDAPGAAAWSSVLRPVLEPFLTFAAPQVVYLTYGKCFTFMIFGWMLGLLALHAMQSPRAGRLEKWGFRLAFTGTVLATIGGIVVYWAGSIWWSVVDLFFMAFQVPSLLLFAVGFPLFGIGTLRAKVAPPVGAWLLIVGGLPGIVLLTALLGQLAMALLLINAAWVVLGYFLSSAGSRVAGQPLQGN